MPQPKGPPRITAPQTLVLPSDNRKQRHLQGGPAFVSYWVARASQASIPDSFFPLSQAPMARTECSVFYRHLSWFASDPHTPSQRRLLPSEQERPPAQFCSIAPAWTTSVCRRSSVRGSAWRTRLKFPKSGHLGQCTIRAFESRGLGLKMFLWHKHRICICTAPYSMSRGVPRIDN